jgi:hypothetical protein
MAIVTLQGSFHLKRTLNKPSRYKQSTKCDKKAQSTKEVRNQCKSESLIVKFFSKKWTWCKKWTMDQYSSHKIRITSVIRRIRSNHIEVTNNQKRLKARNWLERINYCSLHLHRQPIRMLHISINITKLHRVSRSLSRRDCLSRVTKSLTICLLLIYKLTIQVKMSN